jgi:glycosyltransferase involved in cell wall biosynthesis
MPRVMIVHNDSNYFLRHRLPIAHELLRRGAGVHVIAAGEHIVPAESEAWTFEHYEIERFQFSLIKDTAFAAKFIRRILTFRPDSVLLITLKPTLYGGLLSVILRALTGWPKCMVMLIPGLGRLMSPTSEKQRRKLPRRITEVCLSWISRRKNVRFVFETESDRAYLAALGIVNLSKSVTVRGAGVDPDLYFPVSGKNDPGKLRILFASRLMASKGLDVFLDLARAFSSDSRVEFVVAGMSEEADPDSIPAEKLAAMTEITFLGQISDMPNLIRSCDVVCLPTLYGEGIPRILIEAAATGVASIGSDIPGCHEIVIDGKTGFIAKGQSTAGRLNALKSIVSRYLAEPDLAKEQGEEALKHFRSGGFDSSRITQQFVEMLDLTQ